MSQNLKARGTQIADLPEILSDLSAEELHDVAGGLTWGSYSFGSLTTAKTRPASMTVPGKPDTATD